VLSHTLACAQTSIGTPYYTAPEICLGKRYNAKADVWSLGCVLFEMASFARAFEGRSQRQLFDNIVRGETPQLPARGSLSSIRNELQAMVGEMLRKEPRARPSVNQLIRRPLVLERIQGFLSARALASELNHTVLHGQSVFRKKLAAGEDKALPVAPPAAQHVRHAECVPRVSAFKAVVKPAPRQPQKPRKTPPHARNAKARVGSLLGASTRGRGLPQGALRRSRPIQKPARVPAGSNLNGAKQPAVPARARRQGALASAQVKARLKAQLQAAAVAALPDPPTTQKTKTQGEASRAEGKPPGRAERVAAFNAKVRSLGTIRCV
jgi:serine/threonine protein kinase